MSCATCWHISCTSATFSGKNARPPEAWAICSKARLARLAFFLLSSLSRPMVDHSVRLLNFPQCFLQRVVAGVVLAVGHHQQYLLVLCALLHVVERTDDRIV